MRMIGVLVGEASKCIKASAIAVSFAVLLESMYAPKCSGSDGAVTTGPKSSVHLVRVAYSCREASSL